jgi:kumamolisin
MAAGDWGSGNQLVDTHCHLSYPNSDPWVTSCGGTIIGNISATTPITFEEFTWSDGNTASQFQSGVYEATGGGVSDTFPIPAYQTTAGLLPISKNDGNVRRGVPDVAGMVGMDGFFFNGVGGPGTNQLFGTSAVSPLYAALIRSSRPF